MQKTSLFVNVVVTWTKMFQLLFIYIKARDLFCPAPARIWALIFSDPFTVLNCFVVIVCFLFFWNALNCKMFCKQTKCQTIWTHGCRKTFKLGSLRKYQKAINATILDLLYGSNSLKYCIIKSGFVFLNINFSKLLCITDKLLNAQCCQELQLNVQCLATMFFFHQTYLHESL